MVTDDEKSEFDDRYLHNRNNEASNWKEIETLLNFAEELKTKCDYSYDRIFLLDSFQFFSTFISIAALGSIFGLVENSRRDFMIMISDYYSSTGFAILAIVTGLFILSCLFIVFSELYLRKIKRRIKSDLRALDSIVDLLRENFISLTAELSDLQKIHLKIQISRFDIDTKSSIPTSWILSLLKFVFPF